MKRNHFLKAMRTAIGVAPLSARMFATKTDKERVKNEFKVDAGKDRSNKSIMLKVNF